MKTPKWCKDEGKQPYKICWGYANNLKDFSHEGVEYMKRFDELALELQEGLEILNDKRKRKIKLKSADQLTIKRLNQIYQREERERED